MTLEIPVFSIRKKGKHNFLIKQHKIPKTELRDPVRICKIILSYCSSRRELPHWNLDAIVNFWDHST